MKVYFYIFLAYRKIFYYNDMMRIFNLSLYLVTNKRSPIFQSVMTKMSKNTEMASTYSIKVFQTCGSLVNA